MGGGVVVGIERNDGDVRLWRRSPAGDVVELRPHDGAVADGPVEHPLDARDARSMGRIVRLADDDDPLEQLDVIVLAEHPLVDQAVVLSHRVAGCVPGSFHRPYHARRVHRPATRRNAWERNVSARRPRTPRTPDTRAPAAPGSE